MTPAERTEAVMSAIAGRFGLTVADLKCPRRSRRYAWPRQMAYVAVRQSRPHLSLTDIGRSFGNRDRATVIEGISKHNARMAWAEILIAIGAEAYQPDLFARAA